VTDVAPPADTAPPPGPSPLALALAHDLVTRYRLRLVDSRDSRAATLGAEYELMAAAWTGPRAALVGLYQPPADPAAAGRDLAARCDAARRWGHERLQQQGASVCDILLIALGPVAGTIMAATEPGAAVRVGAVWIDPVQARVEPLLPIPPGMPPLGELRARARYVREGNPTPTLAAVDLAERQTVTGGYAAPTRRALITRPVVTYSLIASFVVLYVLEKANSNVVLYGVAVDNATALASVVPDPAGWWRYVSSAFLHDPNDYLHIVFNSLAMLWIGRLVEQLYGRFVLMGTFLATAIVGVLIWAGAGVMGLAQPGLSLGASGGISGLVGLLLVLGRVQGKSVPVGIARSVRNYALIVIALNLVFGFSGLFGSFTGGAPVNNWVHGGSLAAGVLVGLVLPPTLAVGGRDLSQAEKVIIAVVVAVSAVAMVVFFYNVAGAPSASSGIGA